MTGGPTTMWYSVDRWPDHHVVALTGSLTTMWYSVDWWTAQCFCLTSAFNPFPAKPFTLLVLFSTKSGLKEMLKRPKLLILRTRLRFRMYQSWNLRRTLAFDILQQHTTCILCTLPQTSYNVLKAGIGSNECSLLHVTVACISRHLLTRAIAYLKGM